MTVIDAPSTGLKAGPKAARLLEPLDLSEAPKRGYQRLCWFTETFLTIPNGHNAGNPFKLLPFQRDIAKGLFPTVFSKRPSEGLVQIARCNGKSAFAAALALYALFADDVTGPQVLIVAQDLRQASLIFHFARRMIELSEELSKRAKIYQDRIVTPFNDGLLQMLPADADALQGWRPSLAIVDELHVVTRPVYQAMLLSAGKMPGSLLLSISTPSIESESVMWDLVQHGRTGTDPTFYFKEFTSDPTHPLDCMHCVKAANPAYGKFLDKGSMESTRRTSLPDDYRVYRLAQWLDKKSDSWLGKSQVDAVLTKEPIPLGSRVVLTVDGSYSGDSTILTAVTLADVPRAQMLRAWQPHLADGESRVSVTEVEQAVRDACAQYDVVEVAWDRYRWERSMQILESEGFPISEFPQTSQRMSPATISAYEAIVEERVEIVDDPVFVKHLLNARVVVDARGTRIKKVDPKSKDKIDAAVTFVMGFARARHYASQKPVRRRVVAFR